MPTKATQVLEIPYQAQVGPQTNFHLASETEVLFGGSSGGGKTWAIAADAIAKAGRRGKVNVAILRRTEGELWSTFVNPLFSQWLRPPYAEWNGEQMLYALPNKSTIRLAHCQHDEDIHKLDGPPWHYIYFDELTQFTEYQYSYAVNKLLRSDQEGVIPQVKSASNPWGPGVGWVKRRFRPTTWPANTRWVDENGNTRIFIPAKIQDNLELLRKDPNAINRLKSIPDPKMREAYLNGNWDIAVGMFFEEWDETKHVIDDFEVPDWWRRWSGHDFGFSAPYAMLALAKDPTSGLYYFYRELYAAKQTDVEQAVQIRDLSLNESYVARMADPSMWTKRADDVGQSPADVYDQHGVTLTKANNNRLHGALAWRRALAMSDKAVCPACNSQAVTNLARCQRCGSEKPPHRVPLLRIMRSCRNLIRTLPVLPRDKLNPEDVDTDAEEHLYDAGRYVLTAAMAAQEFPLQTPMTAPVKPQKRKQYAWEKWK